MKSREKLKVCLFELFNEPLRNRMTIETKLPMLSSMDGKCMKYTIEKSDGKGVVFDKFKVTEDYTGACRTMTATEITNYFNGIIHNGLVKNISTEIMQQ